MTQVLVLPGYENSGPGHWQTLWERENPGYRRVEQRDWSFPQAGEWTAALHEAVAAASGQVALVAHSLGCIAVARWAAEHPGTARDLVRAALLVAPADVERLPDLPLGSFAPIPRRALPFRTTVVGSRNDPYMAFERTVEFSGAWGADLVDLGDAGHINADSGLGSWPEGRRLLDDLLA
ncbi:RBBP9/YdeN family alpha/beta hydrolase [Thermomonospora cellulosilytica]|uniref:Putative alpha/beta hydrolase family esterase n=1 Tax=Thermomonospora cellulosilytica TaxID=1411118 RepID=A0A7W3R8Y3_9ACTN|nr:alpha/beta fold hydrolase [Thermomonospora cellulosilytica]MBA9003795.1 putative alpha/beta hydrolase family esterase [Thermomonospora cellulosilytica]